MRAGYDSPGPHSFLKLLELRDDEPITRLPDQAPESGWDSPPLLGDDEERDLAADCANALPVVGNPAPAVADRLGTGEVHGRERDGLIGLAERLACGHPRA